MREHASEREKLAITADYYRNVTGELDKAAQTYQETIESYPRDVEAYGDLGVVYALQGQYEKAAEINRRRPSACSGANSSAYAESRQLRSCLAAFRRGAADDPPWAGAEDRMISCSTMLSTLLPFLGRTPLRWRNSSSGLRASLGMRTMGLALASDTEAYSGHLGKAGELTRRAVDSAIRADSKENAAILAGECCAPTSRIRQSRRSPAVSSRCFEAGSRESGRGGRSRACVRHGRRHGTSRIGGARAGQALPAGHADAVALAACDSGAIGAGQKESHRRDDCPATCFPHRVRPDSVCGQYFLPVSRYVRGQAYLAAGQGSAAAAEFQKILDHSGIVWNCWTGGLAHLGVARANALQARASQGADADAARVRALAAYKEFLSLWKDADPDIPILKEAKAEYARLQ